MHASFLFVLHHYGYIGVFLIFLAEMIGAPFPAETTLTFCGVEWARGNFAFTPLWLAAAFGNMVGSIISYGIGYYFGYPVIVRYGRFIRLTPKRVKKAEAKFTKYRTSIVIYGKFLSGIRVLTPFFAGVNRMGLVRFSIWNGISALAWSAWFILEGGYIIKLWRSLGTAMPQGTIVPITIVLGILVISVTIWARHRFTPN